MHNGIPWWLVVVLEAIVHWQRTLVFIALAGAAIWLWSKRK